jgi:hypothetical protein
VTPALHDARDSLAYWETRAQRLPRWAVRRRREARLLAGRWRLRVAQAEREVYGGGLIGALLLLAGERRLPQPVRHAGHRVARRAAQVAVMVAVSVAALFLAGAAAVLELLAAVF